jgi:hypothetical protein
MLLPLASVDVPPLTTSEAPLEITPFTTIVVAAVELSVPCSADDVMVTVDPSEVITLVALGVAESRVRPAPFSVIVRENESEGSTTTPTPPVLSEPVATKQTSE